MNTAIRKIIEDFGLDFNQPIPTYKNLGAQLGNPIREAEDWLSQHDRNEGVSITDFVNDRVDIIYKCYNNNHLAFLLEVINHPDLNEDELQTYQELYDHCRENRNSCLSDLYNDVSDDWEHLCEKAGVRNEYA